MLLCLTWQVKVLNVYCVDKGPRTPVLHLSVVGKKLGSLQLLNIIDTNGCTETHFFKNTSRTILLKHLSGLIKSNLFKIPILRAEQMLIR